jgi:cysteinyl-tRNA synthetase
MSKSEGNFYTVRGLLLQGYKASAIRLALVSVPYRHQMNFTLDGLNRTASAIDRLRTFHRRLSNTKWPEGVGHGTVGVDQATKDLAHEAREKFYDALADDLNTSEAQAAVFDLVRVMNTRADAGYLSRLDAEEVLAVLKDFDAVFDVIRDDDAEITRRVFEEAYQAAIAKGEPPPGLPTSMLLSGEAVEALVAERTAAKKARNFARADQIRNELAEKGVILEDSKDGVRWKRK